MSNQHKHASASAQIDTHLSAATMAPIVEQAAKSAETIQVMIRLEESTPGRLAYSARNRITAGLIEFMTFEVTLVDTGKVRRVSTRILSYKKRRSWILVVPLPWQMLAWDNYKRFMLALVDGIAGADEAAKAQLTGVAGAR